MSPLSYFPPSPNTMCFCSNRVTSVFGAPLDFIISITYGPCTVVATPTPTKTKTPTPTQTPTKTPLYKTWTITTCTATCQGGLCKCTAPLTSVTVYTSPSATNILSATLYTNTSLTVPYNGNFSQNGNIYDVTSGIVSLNCVINGPC